VAARTVQIADADGRIVCARSRVADSFGARLRGLLGASALPSGGALLIRRTNSVHTHFMRFPIDVVFRDHDGRVVSIRRNLRPWRFARCGGATDVIELAAGECDRVGLEEGTTLVDEPVDDES
jgi:uncharacterized membrane protein (UPF0127 family)